MANGECTVGAKHAAEIKGLEDDVKGIKEDYKDMCRKINNINANINRLLGGVAIACILLAINILITTL